MVLFHPRQSCRSIHIPERNFSALRLAIEDARFQLLIKYAYSAVFDHQIALAGFREQSRNVLRVLIHNGADIGKISGIAFLLAAISVRLGEGDLMSQRVQLFVDAPVVSCGPIPVRRGDAGAENKNLVIAHCEFSSDAYDPKFRRGQLLQGLKPNELKTFRHN